MRKIIIYACTSALILAALAVSALAATIYVKPDGSGDYPTIQAGINAAVTGDIVLLAAGTYTGAGNRDIDFMGKAITVTSESGRDVTIIDCEGLGRGFLFQNGETSASVLSGVTIRNGWVSEDVGGGGICCRSSSPAILNNIISGSTAAAGGCFPNCGLGGGIYCSESSPTILSNTISGNLASICGGGIFCDRYSSPAISNNTITGNTALIAWGGGIFCQEFSSLAISNNTISGNTAEGGGGIHCGAYSSPAISNNTISGNSAEWYGGGIYCYSYCNPSITNTIISFSSAGSGIYCEGGNPTLTSCDIYGNAGGDALCGTDGGGNISADPLFCDAGAGNFTLNCTSPCANNPGYGRIGAFGVGCGPTAVENTTWGRVKSMFR